jgi:hypothetical protein
MYFTPDRNCHRAGDRHLRVGFGAGQGARANKVAIRTGGVLSAIHPARRKYFR